jgi:DNA-binding NtrC family response regulator
MGAISSKIAERELFGNEIGAYTGASTSSAGLFELANGGTLFLDEIAEAPLDLQTKLLKVIDEGVFRRVGGQEEIKASFHLICATNRDLKAEVKSGRFRVDLYMRISAVEIEVPALCDRLDDLEDIVKTMLPQICNKVKIFVDYEQIPAQFFQYLRSITIPGNLRGVEHEIIRMLVDAPRDKEGRSLLEYWKPGIGLPFDSDGKRAVNDLIAEELLGFSLRVGPNFPGLSQFLTAVTRKLIEPMKADGKTLRQIGRELKISPATVCAYLKGSQSKKAG